MKLYDFDGIDESLLLIPLAARRALDAIAMKLSLDGFLSLALENRRALVEAGSEFAVDKDTALISIRGAQPTASPLERQAEPSANAIPPRVTDALGPQRPLPPKVWQELSPLARYALDKVARKNRPERIDAAYNELVGCSAISTHIRPQGGVHMVSISEKENSLRKATAECWVTTTSSTFKQLHSSSAPKGDVLGTARLAGIMATKKTSDLIPLCHPLSLQHAEIDFEEHPAESKLRILCNVEVYARTGVEMEAMVGVNIAALTIYDMLKSLDRSMVIGPARLLVKTGGRSGTFRSES